MVKDPYKYFRIEAHDLLEGMADGVLQLEKDSPETSEDAVRRLLRLAHTLKGAARVVKLVRVAEQAHAIEGLLTPFRNTGESVDAGSVEAMLARLDSIRNELASLDTAQATDQDGESASLEQFNSVRIALSELDGLLQATMQASFAVARMGIADDSVREAVPEAGHGPLDRGGWRETVQREALEQHLEELRERVFQLRLLPASSVFADLNRAVRDAAKSADREVHLETRGGELRVDPHVLSNIRGALLHLVRNAVSHGIERPDRRAALGKPKRGLVAVSVQRRGHSVVFTCRDDGRGIDIDAIGRAAARKGLIGEADSLDHDSTIKLLLAGGLTTSETVTEISGRGVGLDAVRETADRLKGEINIHSSEGAGTTVEMIVPLSLSSMPALAVETAGTTLLIPFDVIVGTVKLESDRPADARWTVWQEENLEVVPLASVLGIESPSGKSVGRRMAVVLRAGKGHVAVGVDHVLEVRNIVVHPLPRTSFADATVAGAAFGAMGQPQLVLSPPALIEAVAATEGTAPGPEYESPAPAPVLVIDDSLTTRMLEQSILESAGYEVDLAVSAEDALRKAKERQYGLFIVDVEMPGMDGFEFIAHARKDPELGDIPCILVTSRNAPEDRRRGAEVGVKAYLVKSEFDQAALLGTIRRLIG